MNYTQRVAALASLGDSLKSAINDEALIHRASIHNQWFTPEFQKQAFSSWSDSLKIENLQSWLEDYDIQNKKIEQKTVAIIMAGNIPLVGLHDLISVLACGHAALIKPSSDDTVLMEWIVKE
jgi:acyl-CoA reductase-like NAD-dependent aldehyde dehydrogenase